MGKCGFILNSCYFLCPALGVGEAHGDGMPEVTGHTGNVFSTSANPLLSGPFFQSEEVVPGGTSGTVTKSRSVMFALSQSVSTSNKVQPRAYGVLACAYLGRPK